MSVALITGLGVVLLIIAIAIAQRVGKASQKRPSADGGTAGTVDSGSGPADCSSDGGGGGCD